MRANTLKFATAAFAVALSSGTALAQSMSPMTSPGTQGAANFVFLVDESSSMGGEQTFLQTFVPTFDSTLQNETGVTGSYGLVGYGSISVAARSFDVGGALFGTAADFAAAIPNLQLNGSTEDGYQAIDFALASYGFSLDPAVTNVLILVTDEDRDNTDSSLTTVSVFADAAANNAVISGMIAQNVTDQSGTPGLGATSTTTFLDTNGDGVPELSTPPILGLSRFNTEADYTTPILAQPGGCFGDLDRLRGGGTDADAFAIAFANCLVQIVVGGVPVAPMVDPMILYSSRDALFANGVDFSRQMRYRLTSQYGGPDRVQVASLGPLGYAAGATETDETFGGVFAADAISVETPLPQQRFAAYASLSVADENRDYDGNFTDYDSNRLVGSVGVDYTFFPGTLLGVSFSAQSFDTDSGADDVDGDVLALGLYGSTTFADLIFVDATLSYAWGDLETSRTTAGGQATGETDSEMFTATLAMGTNLELGGFEIKPEVEFGYSDLDIDGFAEDGPGAVTWTGSDFETYWAAPRLDVSYGFETASGVIKPTAGVGVKFVGGDGDPTVATVNAGNLTTFDVPSVKDTVFEARAGLGFVNSSENFSVRADYLGQFSDELESHSGNISLRLKF